MIPICSGCGCLGVSLGDERFCSRCLERIAHDAEIGFILAAAYLDKYWSYQVWCESRGIRA